MNKIYIIINVHTQINQMNKKYPDRTDTFWEEPENIFSKISNKHIIILLGDFNIQLDREKKFQNIVRIT